MEKGETKFILTYGNRIMMNYWLVEVFGDNINDNVCHTKRILASNA